MQYKLFELVSQLEDTRRGQGRRHSLENVLTIILMAILSGHQGLRGFERFAKSNEKILIETLNLKHGIPCYCTFRQVFQSLNEQLFAQKFMAWMKTYHKDLKDGFLSLDGKVVKSTVNGGNTAMQNFVSVVSAFGHQSGMVYGMKSFENGKSGEAKALMELVEELGVTNKIFTMDALHTQKNTFDLILKADCHFLAQVKRNCRKLWEIIALDTALCTPISTCEYYQQSNGRCVFRRIEVYENQSQLPNGWNGIQRLVKVRRWGTRYNKSFEEVTFFVLSKPINSAKTIADAIQQHWSIENELHWTKDVIIGEDDMTPKDKNTVALLVYLNNIALNVLKTNGYKPTKNTFAKFANKVNELIFLFDFNPLF